MRLTGFPLLVASSLLWAATASAAIRPHYGGTLHVAMRAAPSSLDPSDPNQPDWFGSRNLFRLMFDTLVSSDEMGRPEPALAMSWQAEPGNQRWQFVLRRGVTFSDGSPMTADAVAASLRRANPTWKVFSDGEAVVIERDARTQAGEGAAKARAETAQTFEPRRAAMRQRAGETQNLRGAHMVGIKTALRDFRG